MTTMIRIASETDHSATIDIVAPILSAGETYTVARDLDREGVHAYWFLPSHTVFVAEDQTGIVGTYYMMANQGGSGAHVANCGYMVAGHAQGRGIARQMCAHSLDEARRRGFRAMQFNHVVSTNRRAVALWQSMGFHIAGTLPLAFDHPIEGYVDSYVMFRSLA